MGLWIFPYDGADNDDVEKACTIAGDLLRAANITPEAAQDAAHQAADLSTDYDGPTPNGDLVIAWYNAEYAAFQHLQSVTGEWPNGASLIYVEQGD